jgi:hypothetical protein
MFFVHNYDFEVDSWISASVKKMVQPTGIATATMFLPNPRLMNE